ncbi:hypothetical protein K458DRAFT_350957 [Lentithecium fluviatile CBS 122367]|uniref:DUF7732 domain-containing protein n=1 Tax=Lentithecium fluviatile CBS 122367 TaxID=1168545 RepID=A0A6G1IG56_9PLEO|nr:hypothetical protein K458DRAFT_350957 [Lentithecium fluviatile CBS 122367]
MKISYFATYFALAVSAVHAVSVPSNALERLEEHAVSPRSDDIFSPENTLEKRKGGGGKGGGGGSSGGGGGGRSGSGGGAAGRTSPSSNAGGSTRAGTGPSRAFGGGAYYGGGASTPYKSGTNTPKGLAPGLLLGGVAILAIMPGLWLYSVYPYHFNNPYRFYNQSAQNATNPNGTNQSLPVTCLCQEYSVCGCDENDDQTYLNDLVGNGSYAALNKTLVTVSDVNGTMNLVINGSLPNGTTAPGGTDDDDSAAITLSVGKYGGYWVMGLIVVYTCVFM